MSDIDLGMLRAGVELDLSGLTVGTERATALVEALGEEMRSGFGSLTATVQSQMAEASASITSPATLALTNLKRLSAETREAIASALEDIFRQTHNRGDILSHRAQQTYQDDRKSGVPEAIAQERLRLRLDEIAREAARRATTDDMALERARFEAERSDALATQRLNEAIARDRQRAMRDDMALEVARFEAERRDREAVQAAETAWFQERVRQNREELERDTWEQEVAQRDRESIAAQKATQAPLSQAQQMLRNALQQMREGIEGILGGAFEQVFMGDTRNLFKNLLQSFEQLLAQMAAKALAAGIVNAIFGGSGGFLGGVLGAFGFDDATNDTKAARWGYDFQHFFDTGRADYRNTHGTSTPADASGHGEVHLYLHIGEVHNHTEADMGRMAEELAWHVQTGLRGRFT